MNRCPKCKTQTDRVHYEGAPLRMCGQCGGYWVSDLALKAIANRREVRFDDAVKERFMQLADQSNSTEPLLCISCGKYMKKEQFKDWEDIVIDRCLSCGGIWLDAGELEKIQIYWEYFQDHPEESDIDIIERRAILEAQLAERNSRTAQPGDPAFSRPIMTTADAVSTALDVLLFT